jgi:hypothetical protein
LVEFLKLYWQITYELKLLVIFLGLLIANG